MKPTWKNTFNTDLSRYSMQGAVEAAHRAGYPFIAWNGNVFKTPDPTWKTGWGEPICTTENL